MIQIAFEPAFDPFHAAFRILRQISFRGDRPVQTLRAKIVDLYIAEPRRCLEIRVPPKLSRSARAAATNQSPTYGQRPSTYALFDRMSPMQDAAIQTMVLQGLLDADAFKQRQLQAGEVSMPDRLAERIARVNEAEHSLMTFVCDRLDEIELDGPNGLKARTKLGEFRYDVV